MPLNHKDEEALWVAMLSINGERPWQEVEREESIPEHVLIEAVAQVPGATLEDALYLSRVAARACSECCQSGGYNRLVEMAEACAGGDCWHRPRARREERWP